MNLPKQFLDNMKKVMNDSQYEKFLLSFSFNSKNAININNKKLNDSEIELETLINLWKLKSIDEFNNNYFVYDKNYLESENIRLGKNILFDAGLYYIQEPSAMHVVPYLDIEENHKVLDLCASPGGKSVQVMDFLDENSGGFLISNEIDKKRAVVLSRNIEKMGFSNVIVTSETPNKLSTKFNEYFDRIIVDAPCSGEGMFRKNPLAIEEWSIENVCLFEKRQKEIVDEAYKMLKCGGKMSYSTCTLEKSENEDIVD